MPQLTTLAELAKEFNCNKSKLQFWYKEGFLPSTQTIGGMLLFDRTIVVPIIKEKLKI
jgi:DNA-binding transcriptional MerR regulator